MTPEISAKLQEKADVLTQQRKNRGRPEVRLLDRSTDRHTMDRVIVAATILYLNLELDMALVAIQQRLFCS